MPGPLDGFRVLDLTRILAGPYCSMVLGDLGADVIKIERPGSGDDTRSWGPPFADGESAYFLCINRNKRSVTVNLTDPEGVRIVRELARRSDVVMENFLPGKADELGLGYAALSAENPRLVYASITGFGPDGPSAQTPGYDAMVAARGGLMGITGEEEGSPVKVGVALTDVTTGLFAHGAILAALLARQRTGRGQKIDVSLLESQVAVLINIASSYLIGGKEARRWGTAHESIVPYQAFKTADGHLTIGAGNDRLFARLCTLLGLPELVEDPRFLHNAERVANRSQLIPLLRERFLRRGTAAWLKELETAGVPHAPINTMAQVFSDPQVLHRGMVQEVRHPTAGTIKLVGIPVKYNGTPASIRLPPPTLGQHTDEVLGSLLGFDAPTIQSLRQRGVV